MKTVEKKEALLNERKRLISQLNEKGEEILPLLKDNERQLKALNIEQLLERVNGKYNRRRELARLVYECEQPGEDVTNSDGTFHKTKIKRYPKLAALQYARGTFKDGVLCGLFVFGESFKMHRIKYEYGKPDEYTRPGTFAEFLELNEIPKKELTVQEYSTLSERLAALNAELNASIEKYKAGLDALDVFSFQHWGLVGQRAMHLYEYSTIE